MLPREGIFLVSKLQKCVLAKPAGRRVSRDEVAWYDVSFSDFISKYFNTGDMTVYDSTLKILDHSEGRLINIDEPVDYALVEMLNANFDYVVLRASNYIHEDMEWGNFVGWLEALRLPVLCLGVGAQAAEMRRIDLPPTGKRVWDIISERSPSIGVRGEFTADVLASNGIKNVDVVGCPSLFRHLQPELSLRHKDFEDIKRVGFSLRRETDHTYTTDVAKFLSVQKQHLFRVNEAFDLVLTTHGEVEEKSFYYNDILTKPAARDTLTECGWFDSEAGSALESIYERNLFFTPVVSHYDEVVRNLDFTFGYRVHGVLPSLAVGTPSLLLKYDARSAELARTLNVPLLDPEEALQESFSSLFHRDRFVDFESSYPLHYARMADFLDRNNIAHRMRPRGA